MNPRTYNTDNNEPRLCGQCYQKQPVSGGEYIASADGLRQRWYCSTCARKKKEKTQ